MVPWRRLAAALPWPRPARTARPRPEVVRDGSPPPEGAERIEHLSQDPSLPRVVRDDARPAELDRARQRHVPEHLEPLGVAQDREALVGFLLLGTAAATVGVKGWRGWHRSTDYPRGHCGPWVCPRDPPTPPVMVTLPLAMEDSPPGPW